MRGGAFTAIAVAAAVVVSACGEDRHDAAASARLQVVTALYPLRFLAERIGGDEVAVSDLTPTGAEPHDLELTASQVGALSDADLVVYVGGGFQPAVEDVVDELPPDKKLDALTGLETVDDVHDHEDSRAPAAHPDEAGEVDPHVWLSPRLFGEVARRVAARLAEIDPKDADAYASNAREVVSDLEALDHDMRDGLKDCERRAIVVSHEAFGYLTAEFGLRQVGIAGLDPEAEPSPARLAEVEEFAEDHGVTTIFFEELVSPEVAEALADELGISTDVLSPLESAPQNGDYLTAMRSNLASLRSALDCS